MRLSLAHRAARRLDPLLLNALRISICLTLTFTLGNFAHAQQPSPVALHLDPATAQIRWTLNTTLHTVQGSFKLKSGDIRIDPATGNISGLIVIDSTSGESADSARDKRMHSAVLESAKYPTITFRPTHVNGSVDLASNGAVKVDGIFNLHGQDHPLQLTINLHPHSAGVALTTHFSIPFVAWGLKDPSTFIFRTDKEVILDIDAVATRGPQ